MGRYVNENFHMSAKMIKNVFTFFHNALEIMVQTNIVKIVIYIRS